MTTYNTGNPVPSADARDRYDNSQTLDEVVNGDSESYTSRTGKQVISLGGMNSRFNNAQEARESAFNLSQEAFQSFLEGSGWSSIGAYGAGLAITSHTQTVDYLGQPYALKPSIPASLTTPYVTTGVWATEGAKFKLVGDNSLRQDLAATDGAALVGYKGRTVYQRLSDVVSVKDFGAIGDGVADDAAAINKAAALGRTVAFPDGVYLCKSVINVTTDNVKFQGSRKAILKLNASGQAGDNGVLVKANNFGTEGLTLETVVRGIAIQVTPVSSAGLKGVRISGTAFENVFYSVRCGLGVNDANNWRVSDIQIINCKSTAPVGENAGHFFCTKSDDILYQGNTVFNGKNSSAYGVAKCTRIAIMNNFEYGVEDSLDDVEAAIQIEDSPNSKTTIMGNICNHDIWISGGEDVIVSGNKCRELRATVGNPDDQGGNRIKFIGNSANSIRCSKYGESSASIILTETEFANNTLDPASCKRNGQAIQYAIYIDATDFVGKLIFTGNKVISNSAGSCISLNRASNALVLHALFNDFGSQNHSYSGTLGYIYEQGNANPMLKGATEGGNYIAAGLLGNLTANENTWTAFQLANNLTDVNSEFVSGLFTPKASGIYRFSGIVTAQPGGAGSQIGFRLVQASAEIARLAFLRSADNGSLGVPLRTVDIYLAAGASVQVEYFVTGGTVILASNTNTMLNISRVA